MASELRELIMKWRIAAKNSGKARAKAFTRCADDLAALLAAQPAPMSRNEAFNLADTVAEHYACGRPEEARQAIMAMAAQPATVPEGMSLLVDALEGAMIESLHGEGFDLWAKNRGKLRNRLPESVGAIIVKMRAMLAAAPSPAAVKDSLTTAIDEAEDILRATLAEHGVRSDGEAKALASRVRETLRSAMQAATCNQPLQVQPEAKRCEACDNTGDIHRADGEYLGACPHGCDVPEAQAGADDSHYGVIFEAVKSSVREIASSRGWQSLGLRDQEYIAGRVMRDLAAAIPKPAEGGAAAIMQALLNKLHSVANEHGDRSCDYDVCKEVRDAFQFIQTAGSGEAVAWRFYCNNPQSITHGKWTAWSSDPAFRILCETQGYPAEFAYAGAPPAADTWKTIEEMCVITEAVTPDSNDVRGTINKLIDYHVRLAGGEGA